MPQKKGQNRNALQILNLEDQIDQDSIVRIVDLYIDVLDISELGFIEKGYSHEGRPAYKCKVLLGIYLYGYLNKLRSSRELEKGCKVNIELWWLLDHAKPSYKTISDFRKDNKEGFENLFADFKNFCLGLNLYGKKRVAIDGTKIRAQNSMKNNYNAKKIKQHLDYIEQQEQNYYATLEKNDGDIDTKAIIDKKLKSISKRKKKYKDLEERLSKTKDKQISTVDPDARSMVHRRNIAEVCYNIQSSVDDKYKLIANVDVINKVDSNALSGQSEQVRQAFGLEKDETLIVLADKGYHTGEQLAACQANGIETLVAYKKSSSDVEGGRYSKESFIYDADKDVYICPAKQSLTTKGRVRQKKGRTRITNYKYYSISSSICEDCPLRNRCLTEKQKSRGLDRNEFDYAVEQNREAVKNRKEEYRRRQAIVEHPFGTIKRQWGYNYTLLKGMDKVKTEMSLIFLCYNIKRVINILGVEGLKRELKALYLGFLCFFMLAAYTPVLIRK